MLKADDLRHHTEVGTGYSKDAQLARAADEIDRLRAALEGLLPFVTGDWWPGAEADAAIDVAVALVRKAG